MAKPPAPSPRSASRCSRGSEMPSYRRPEDVRRITVVGSGLIGSGWVTAFLASGREVAVYDPSPEAPNKIRAHIAASWPAMVELGLADRGDPDAVSFHRELADAGRGTDHIQENTP